MAWARVQFGEFLHPNSRPYTLGPEEDANLVGMRLYGAGPFHRELKPAMQIAKKSHFVIRTGDVIYNKLFAWKGTFGIVPSELDSMFVSDKFPTYELDRSRVDVDFLRWYFRYPPLWEEARTMSTGSAALSKLTLNPPKFLHLTIPLPPLSEQRCIVARTEALAAKIAEAHTLRRQAVEEAESLFRSAASKILSALPTSGTLAEVLLEKPRNGWSARCDNADSGIPVLTLSAVTGFHYNSSAFKRTSELTNVAAHYWLQFGDLLITRSNSPDLVGHVAIYDGSPSPCIYPDLMMKLKVARQVADARFVWFWLQTLTVRDYIGRHAKGTSPTMKKITQGVVMEIPFPTGTQLTEQRRIVAYLDGLQANVGVLKRLQSETAAELDAMLPAILDRAFKGELTSTEAVPVVLPTAAEPVPVKHSRGIFYRRAAIDAYIVNALRDDRNLGRTKLEKLSHLLEYHCGVDLEREPLRDAAGPIDNVSRRKVESLAVKQRWYSVKEAREHWGMRVSYTPGPKIANALAYARKTLGAHHSSVDDLIAMLRPLDTKQSEIIATLYAAWNDLLLAGKNPTDDEIVIEAREHWHPSKQEISVDRWVKGLRWLRHSGLVPHGTGKPVRHLGG